MFFEPRAYARDDARRNAPKVQRSERKDAPGCAHVLRWMAGRVARPNPAKDYVWNASDPTDVSLHFWIWKIFWETTRICGGGFE